MGVDWLAFECEIKHFCVVVGSISSLFFLNKFKAFVAKEFALGRDGAGIFAIPYYKL